MTKSICSNCRNQMTGWDGGFFGEPVTCECRIHGLTEGRKSCSEFKKRVTKSDLVNKIKELEEEKVELMEDCACQYRQIQKLESENDDLKTTITKQVEAITEMKDIIYMLQDLRIGDYSSEIEEDMQELKKAYDGTLEDFLNYFKDE